MTSIMTLNQHKHRNYVIIASLKSESIGELINTFVEYQVRVFGYKVYQAWLWITHVEWLAKPRDVNERSQGLAR